MQILTEGKVDVLCAWIHGWGNVTIYYRLLFYNLRVLFLYYSVSRNTGMSRTVAMSIHLLQTRGYLCWGQSCNISSAGGSRAAELEAIIGQQLTAFGLHTAHIKIVPFFLLLFFFCYFCYLCQNDYIDCQATIFWKKKSKLKQLHLCVSHGHIDFVK
jgi:hypothetical protein